MNPLGLDPVLHEVCVEPVGPVLGAGEDQRLPHVASSEECEEERGLQFLRNGIDGLGDPDSRRGLPLQVHRHRPIEHLSRELDDRRRHGGAEEKRLPLGRNVSQHAPDVGQKSHVEHPVRLIQHEVLDPGQLGVRRAKVIEQPAGRGDEDVHPGPERVLLRPHSHATEDRGRGDGRVGRQLVQIFQDLRRELARRCEHQRARRPTRLVDQPVENRQQEGGSLAAPRHRAREHVPALERGRDGLRLNGRRTDEAKLLDAFEETGMELETAERHGRSEVRGRMRDRGRMPRARNLTPRGQGQTGRQRTVRGKNDAGSSTGRWVCRQNSGVGPRVIWRPQSAAPSELTRGSSVANSAA